MRTMEGIVRTKEGIVRTKEGIVRTMEGIVRTMDRKRTEQTVDFVKFLKKKKKNESVTISALMFLK